MTTADDISPITPSDTDTSSTENVSSPSNTPSAKTGLTNRVTVSVPGSREKNGPSNVPTSRPTGIRIYRERGRGEREREREREREEREREGGGERGRGREREGERGGEIL